MPDPCVEARIRFLDDSARALQIAAPSTSAHLMLERNNVAEENEKSLSKAQLKDICKACGTILIPDVTAKFEAVDLHPSKKKRARVSAEPVNVGKRFKTECLTCHRVVRIQNQAAKTSAKSLGSIQSSRVPTSKNSTQSRHAEAQFEKPASANVNSKKRSKARKQGGLQALLEKSKEMEIRSPGLGLDLMDFMKKT
ncbi:MAG: hypothetical protein Q9218_001513 [Villophora microphyllina]